MNFAILSDEFLSWWLVLAMIRVESGHRINLGSSL